jgi:hypothetical protein
MNADSKKAFLICIANHQFLVAWRENHQAAFGMSRFTVAL